MFGNSALGWLKVSSRDSGKSLTAKRRGNRRRHVSFIPRLESLEDRSLPSTLTVLNNADSGPGSLRDTIAVASNGDTIVFDNKLNGQTIKLTSGQLTLDKNLDIEGLGAKNLTVSGNDSSRVFDVAAGVTATIAKLAIAHGMADMGGGIDNAGTLTLNNDILSGNRAVGGLGGGGILNEATASLTVNSTLLNGNQAIAGAGLDVFGGGLLNLGSATVNATIFNNNQALGGAAFTFFGGSVGGAIDNFGGASLTVTGSTFTHNQAVGAAGPFFGIGGAIENNAGFDLSKGS